MLWKTFLHLNPETPDTQTYVCVPGGYSMLMWKRFALRNFK